MPSNASVAPADLGRKGEDFLEGETAGSTGARSNICGKDGRREPDGARVGPANVSVELDAGVALLVVISIFRVEVECGTVVELYAGVIPCVFLVNKFSKDRLTCKRRDREGEGGPAGAPSTDGSIGGCSAIHSRIRPVTSSCPNSMERASGRVPYLSALRGSAPCSNKILTIGA